MSKNVLWHWQMLKFSVGSRWSSRFLDVILCLNDLFAKHGSVVYELYGSLKSSASGLASARPDFRIPDVMPNDFKTFIERAHLNNIRINYTLNAPMCQSVQMMASEKPLIIDTVKRLVDLGVDTFTVANSLLFEILGESIDLPFEVSSLLHTSSVSQIPIYKQWGVSQICMDVTRNRDFSFLKSYCEMAHKDNIETKLLVNEMCIVGGAPCVGVYQADCVIHSSLGGNEQNLFCGWPFSRCSTSRNNNPSAWLKSRFILPQWLKQYHYLTGISHYKITGRTCPTDWLLGVVKVYLGGRFQGDIRDLWIDPGQPHAKWLQKDCEQPYLQAENLDRVKFLDKWLENPGFRCDEHCGHDCFYCNQILEIKLP